MRFFPLIIATAVVFVPATLASSVLADTVPAAQRESALLQTWDRTLSANKDSAHGRDTPVTRVVRLLKEMQGTLMKEMDEDAALYDKLACWCNNNEYEKKNSIDEAEAKVTDLTSSIESLTAKSAELKSTLQTLESDIAENKKALAAAQAIRDKEAKAFHGLELEHVQMIENLKAAILVLSRHHGSALPQVSFSLMSMHGQGRKGRSKRWDGDHESRTARSFDEFMDKYGFDEGADESATSASSSSQKFLQQEESAASAAKATGSSTTGWSAEETAIFQRALHTASQFMQTRHMEDYYPSYSARSGEIMGLLKELKEQMEAELSEAQKTEMAAATNFADLRASKMAEIEAAEKQSETKEDELAKASMDLAEAKEDLEQTQATLSEDQKFMMNLKTTCKDADQNFEKRKSARLEEIKAVSDAIEILTADEARDSMSKTFSLLQMSSTSRHTGLDRKRAADLLKKIAKKSNSPELSILATRVELDSFARVKKAIDDMVAILKTQQADEVKKNDWCNGEFHQNEMDTAKTEDTKQSLSTKAEDLDSSIKTLEDEIVQAKAKVSELQTQLQRATENRQKENLDFQATVADQRATQAVLKAALEKLATYYDKEEFVQTGNTAKQTPPVAQMEYKKHGGASGAMSLIEKLIYEAKELEKESQKDEMSAQAQYEALIADTNASIAALLKEVAAKTGVKADTVKDKIATESDLKDTVGELEELQKYNVDIHAECDYVVKNFSVRQEARSQEIEALQQAKQILSGAEFAS